MSSRRLRRRLDAAHEQGQDDGCTGRRRDPSRPYNDPDYRYARWAYEAGRQEAEARRRRETPTQPATAPTEPPQPATRTLDLLTAESHGILDLLFPRRRR